MTGGAFARNERCRRATHRLPADVFALLCAAMDARGVGPFVHGVEIEFQQDAT